MNFQKILLFLLFIGSPTHVVRSMEEGEEGGLRCAMKKLSLDSKPLFGWLDHCSFGGLTEQHVQAIRKGVVNSNAKRDIYQSKQGAMFNAIKAGDLASFKRMFCGKRYKVLGLKTPVQKFLFVRDHFGNTVLHAAILYRRFEIVKCIAQALEGKVLCDELSQYAYTNAECEQDVIPYIKRLINKGRWINGLTNVRGFTPYAYALKLRELAQDKGSDRVLNNIINYFGKKKSILLHQGEGIIEIPLFSSCVRRNTYITKTLLDAGAFINVRNDIGCTLLHFLPAYYRSFYPNDDDHVECFDVIYDILLAQNDIDINAQELKFGGSPLLAALKFNDVCLVNRLLARDDLDLSLCDCSGNNVFHRFADSMGNVKRFKDFICFKKLFLKLLKRVDLGSRSLLIKQNKDRKAPLHFFVQQAPTLTSALIKKIVTYFGGDAGKHLDALDNDGLAPLHYAISKCTIMSIVPLLAHGASVISTGGGKSCTDIVELHMRKHEGITDQECTEVLRMLEICQQRDSALSFSVDDVVDDDGSTYLHVAARKGQYFVAQMLLMMGASAIKINKLNETPLSLVSRDCKMLVELIAKAVLDEVRRIAEGD